MDFHETGFGHTFFRGQLPALIHALKDIGTNLGKLVELQSAAASMGGHQILLLPSVDGASYQGAVLTPQGMTGDEACQIAGELLGRLFEADDADPDHDFNWTDLAAALEAKGFRALPTIIGPTWDSHP